MPLYIPSLLCQCFNNRGGEQRRIFRCGECIVLANFYIIDIDCEIDIIQKMKKLFLFIPLFLMFIFCVAKREVVAPVLLEHEILYPVEARDRGYEGLVLV